jgi:flagellar basal-body rod protein FlgF
MSIGLYNAATTMSSLERWQEVTSQNLSSSTVPGYKKNDMRFEAIHAGVMGLGQSGKQVMMPASMSVADSVVNFGSGELMQTGVPGHLAIGGNGFFRMQGNGAEYLSRDGEFHLNPEGVLVNKNNDAVLGEGGSIRVDLAKGEITVKRSGEVIQEDAVVGKIAVVDVEDASVLQRVRGGFRVDPDRGDVALLPQLQSSLHQGNLENSNVQPLKEMINLISIARAYELNQKTVQTLDTLDGRLIEVMGATT